MSVQLSLVLIKAVHLGDKVTCHQYLLNITAGITCDNLFLLCHTDHNESSGVEDMVPMTCAVIQFAS